MISSLCQFADDFPREIASDLEYAKQLKHQWRETSITDRLLFNLKRLNDPRIIVRASNERTTHADMDWFFTNVTKGTITCITLQAKILHYTKVHTNDRYDELAHPHSAPGRQARSLVRNARTRTNSGLPTYPMYIFYNPSSAKTKVCPHPDCNGVTLANGYRIARHLKAHISNGKIPNSAMELNNLNKFMFCLPSLFCRPQAEIPSPEDIISSLILTEKNVRRIAGLRTRVPKPEVGQHIPEEIRRLLERPSIGLDYDEEDRLERSIVVFRSEE